MSEANLEARDTRVQAVVLLRLLPRGTRALSRKLVTSSVVACLAGSVGEDDVARILGASIDAGLVNERPLALSESGREALRAALGIETLPAPRDWREAQRSLLTDLAFGNRQAQRPRSGDQLAASILAREHGFPGGITLKAATDRLCWRALGVESDAPFDVQRVQRHLLRDLVPPDARVSFGTFRRLVAVRAVGAKRGDAAGLREAAIIRWARGEARVKAAHGEPKLENDNGKPLDLRDLAESVKHAAREPDVARFHDDRAFIGSIWEHMRRHAPGFTMSLEAFKEQLVAAHRAGLLRITRADLVGAMNLDEVERSEARYMGASFHFVALDAGGAR